MHKIIILLLILLASCTKSSAPGMEGNWKFHLNLKDNKKLPFIVKVNKDMSATLINGGEKFDLKIEMKVIDGKKSKTEFKIPLHVFDAGIEGKFYFNKDKPQDSTQHIISGEWIKYYKKDDYRVKLFGHKTEKYTVNNYAKKADNILYHEKWSVTFDDKNKSKAIGYFKQNGSKVTGTFLTDTGDYRYLEGQVTNDRFELYGFDGGFANIVSARILKDRINGEFWSGKGHHVKWSGVANADAKLSDPYSLTFLKDKKTKLDFSLTNIKGEKVKLNDKKYDGKVKIIQISGTWCPNCMDEAKFMGRWYDQNKHRGVEIFSLFFERAKTVRHAFKVLNKYAKEFKLNYEIILADFDGGKDPLDIFPQLNKIMSYPTTIFINKKGKVQKIHSGFSGPGTGEYYEKFKREFNFLMNDLLDN
jgi:thiol-disulfide isomerase/thioredoxin